MLNESTRFRLGKLYARFLFSSIVLAIAGFAHGFCIGVLEAGWAPPFVPTALIAAYCSPAHVLERVPVLGIWLRLANDLGYQYADGPETTR